MPSTQILWPALGALGLALLCVIAYLVAKHRRLSLRKTLSAQLGLNQKGKESDVKASGALDTPLFANTGARCLNILRGEVRGAEAFLFDYLMSGAHRHAPDPMVLFRPRDSHLPRFELRPRMSSQDPRGLDFESDTRFSEIYALTGDDEAALRDLFGEDVLEFFDRGENQSWAVASTGDWVAVAFWPIGERSHPLQTKEVMGFVEDAKEVLFLLTRAAVSPASR